MSVDMTRAPLCLYVGHASICRSCFCMYVGRSSVCIWVMRPTGVGVLLCIECCRLRTLHRLNAIVIYLLNIEYSLCPAGRWYSSLQCIHDITVSKNRSSKSACRCLDLLDLHFLHGK